MKNIYFDLCSIPFFLLILWTCHSRKLTQGHANKLFVLMAWMSLICASVDILMEYVVNPVPLSQARVFLGYLCSYSYKTIRNASLVIYILYILAVTRTEYRIRPLRMRLLLWLPDGILIALLVQNLFTHNVFVITSAGGCARGPLLSVFYIIAMIYGIAGAAYCIYCKRYLQTGKWVPLFSVYVLTFAGVLIQMVRDHLLVEMFSTSIGMTMILLLVMRPEETIDSGVGIQNWNAYQSDLRNLLMSKERMQILVVCLSNADQTRSYLGDDRFNSFLSEIADELRGFYTDGKPHVSVELYIERPGTFYLLHDDPDFEMERHVPIFLEKAHNRLKRYTDLASLFQPKIALIRCPEDMFSLEEIINFGHKFPQLGKSDQTVFLASAIVQSKDYEITSHIEEILNRAITENRLEMYYQPIYDIKTGRFHSAEALARLKDSKYGMISPAIFIPAAEASGLILTIGEIVLESVFRFISEHDMGALGLSYIEVNLSVAQVLHRDLTQIISSLQAKYDIDPKTINFEITETLFDNISEVMDRNVRKLKNMGYSFSLDDYGTGYSNIQRMSKLPLDIIKIDKSLVDEMFTKDGQVIIRNTVRMMQGIHKELVIEGVETKEAIEALAEMDCDYIQGFYYSRPLPASEFVQFLREHNG